MYNSSKDELRLLLMEINLTTMITIKEKSSIFISFFIVLVQLACAQTKSEQDQSYVEQLDQDMPKWLEEFVVPGAAFALIENGELVLQKGYGFADLKNRIEVDKTTSFNIASISKTVTAWGVMKLVEEGKIELDSSAEKYLSRWQLPASEFNNKGVTIRRLLSHTAGLSLHGYPGWSPKDTLPSIEESLSGKTNGSGAVYLISEPGSNFRYSGGGYTLLQLIIEEVSGKKFADYMQTEVLNPLGMKNSSFKIDEKMLKTSSQEHNSFGNPIPLELFTAQAAAGLHTTIEDLSLFALLSLNRPDIVKTKQSILSHETVELMTQADSTANGRYGLGYSIQRMQNDSILLVGHGGANDGWKSYLQVNQKSGDGFIMITNSVSGNMVFEQAFCKWIDLKYGVWLGGRCLKSTIPLMINAIHGKGVDAAIHEYRSVKKNAKEEYYFSEGELNLLGYELLWMDSVQQALTIFEMIIEEYPSSFNTYDSYGEALLADGQESLAIENYTKSIKLNPANKNGIRILERLGVKKEDILYQVPMEVLKQLEGEYLAVEMPNEMQVEWRIRLEIIDGQLFGYDKDYRYSLLAVEKNKFINPDNGVSVVFDMSKPDSISFKDSRQIKFLKIK